eukprot:gene45655-55883_t
MDSAVYLSLPLPPPWRQEVVNGDILYINDVTGQSTSTHPFHIYMQFKEATTADIAASTNDTNNQDHEIFGDTALTGSLEEPVHHDDEQARFQTHNYTADYSNQASLEPTANDVRPSSRLTTGSRRGGGHLDYHCQWSERDVFGKVTLYGLTLRVFPDEVGKTLLKFDGMDGEWEYIALKGPYGSLELHDLYIGAKVSVFGRHLTISSANRAAVHFIDEERRRLMRQQEAFRQKIESLGHVPVVRKAESHAVKHIVRDHKTKGHVNLRALMKDNAKLGEQLASLGLAAHML